MTPGCDFMYLEYFSSQCKLCCQHICHLQAHLCHPRGPGSLPIFFLSHFCHLRRFRRVQEAPPLSHVHPHPVAHPSPPLHARHERPLSRLAGSGRRLTASDAADALAPRFDSAFKRFNRLTLNVPGVQVLNYSYYIVTFTIHIGSFYYCLYFLLLLLI